MICIFSFLIHSTGHFSSVRSPRNFPKLTPTDAFHFPSHLAQLTPSSIGDPLPLASVTPSLVFCLSGHSSSKAWSSSSPPVKAGVLLSSVLGLLVWNLLRKPCPSCWLSYPMHTDHALFWGDLQLPDVQIHGTRCLLRALSLMFQRFLVLSWTPNGPPNLLLSGISYWKNLMSMAPGDTSLTTLSPAPYLPKSTAPQSHQPLSITFSPTSLSPSPSLTWPKQPPCLSWTIATATLSDPLRSISPSL